MTKNVKRMGDRWERDVAKTLKGKRQPSSGAFGTQHNDASLTGDVVVKYPWFHKALHLECKVGYGGSKQMTIQRLWFDKVREEARKARRIAAVVLKFKNVTGGDRESAKVICFNLDTWLGMMKELEYLYHEYLSLLEEKYEEDNG